MAKWVYFFGAGKAEGDGTQRALLGGKGAGLAEMSRIGLPVPPGLHHHDGSLHLLLRKQEDLPKSLDAEVRKAVARVEKIMGTKFGDNTRHADAGIRPFRRARFDARHDGHDFEPRAER